MAKQTIFALFQTVADAERAIGALEDRGVAAADIGVVSRRASEIDETTPVRSGFERKTVIETPQGEDPIVEYQPTPTTTPSAVIGGTTLPTSSVDTVNNVETVGKSGLTTTTGQDAAAGAAIGTGAGLITGLLAAAAALTIPGFGIILAGGALATAATAALATTAAGAAIGGVTGYLRDMGMGQAASSVYHDRIVEGDYLVSVAVESVDYDDVKRILSKYNAAGIDVTASDNAPAQNQVWGARPEVTTHFERAMTTEHGTLINDPRLHTSDIGSEPTFPISNGNEVSVADSERALADIPDEDIERSSRI